MFVVIGTTTVDLVVRGFSAVAGLEDGFRTDNLVFCDEPLLMQMGGNGGNSAYVLGKLGVKTALCSSIGQDDLGKWLARNLAEQHVKLGGLVHTRALATSSSTILLDSAEKQTVFHHKGASDAMSLTAVHESLYAQAEVLLASSYTLFTQMRPGGFARALQLTHNAGGITALDIGPAIGKPATTQEIAPLFQHIDYLIANTHELMVCTGATDWETAASDLLAQGCRCVVIKRGSTGTTLLARGVILNVPSFPVSSDISVGAGDSFNAGFLYALWTKRSSKIVTDSELSSASSHRSPDKTDASQISKKYSRQDIEDSLRFGSAVAALVISRRRGVLCAPTLAEVEEFLGE